MIFPAKTLKDSQKDGLSELHHLWDLSFRLGFAPVLRLAEGVKKKNKGYSPV